MKKTFDHHVFLKQQLDNDILKLYYFRFDNDNQNYECEEYIYKDKLVLDLIHGQSSKEYFETIRSQPQVSGVNPLIYFEYKRMDFKAFNEHWEIHNLNSEL